MIVEVPKTTVLWNPSLQGVLTLEETGNQCSEPGSPTKMFPGTQHTKELGNVVRCDGEQTVTVLLLNFKWNTGYKYLIKNPKWP